jgi:hypothetical protein
MYCMRCRINTQDDDVSERVTKNGRHQRVSTCRACGAKKSTFIKASASESSGSGVFQRHLDEVERREERMEARRERAKGRNERRGRMRQLRSAQDE